MGAQLANLADVKRALHRDQNDTAIDDALSAALEAAMVHVTRYLRRNYAQPQVQNTWTINDRPEDSLIPMPVEGATVTQIRFYRTPSATAYIGKPLIDYEVIHDGLRPPANLVVAPVASGGTFTAGSYFWVVTAVNGVGETNGSNEYTATIANGGSATIAAQLYGGEQFINLYRVTVQGTESTNGACFVKQVPAAAGVPIPGQTGGPLTVAFTDTGTAVSAGSVPLSNGTATVPARKIRLHPTYFDMPFEGAVSQHFPDNWSRVEVDYIPSGVVPPDIRDAAAITAASLYLRAPRDAAGYSMEKLGDYMWSVRNFRGVGGANEIIPETAKALLRPYRLRLPLTT